MGEHVPKEKDEQKMFVSFLREMQAIKKVVRWHCDLSGMYTKSMKIKNENRAMGLTPGFPDLFVVYRDKLNHEACIFIEMKRTKGGKVQDTQWEWIETLSRCGLDVQVCKGFEPARNLMFERMGISPAG